MSKLPKHLIFEEQPVTAPSSPPIVAVTNRQQFQTFLQFPRQLYRGDPFWTPPFAVEEGHTFDARHPFWKYAECQLFLYQDNGRTLGRVAVFADHHYIQQTGESVGCFGYFEAVNAVAVAGALLTAARDWLAARGIHRLRGPINGKLENGCAFLLEGFNRPPFVTMPYNPPYYIDLMEQLGLEKARDLVAYRIDLTQPIPAEVAAAAERCLSAG
ncbi:MAG TPA: hypothetical protein VHO69_14180, partial [Phototrophicaceae bacterium]|nr:hypothetical protein [Phototrophicaceae bacterium]